METVILPALRMVVRPGLELCLTRAAIPLSIITVLLIITLTVTERDESETTPTAPLAIVRQTNEVTSESGTAT